MYMYPKKEQEWVKKWKDIALSTEPADFDSTIRAIEKSCDLFNQKPPKIITCKSPFSLKIDTTIPIHNLTNISLSHTGFQIRNYFYNTILARIASQYPFYFKNHVLTNITYKLQLPAFRQVWDSNGFMVFGGSFNTGMAPYITYFRDVLGFTGAQHFEIFEEFVKNCYNINWQENQITIVDRPKEINLDNGGNLHSLTKPAISYRDGKDLYFVNGTYVPNKWIKDKNYLTPSFALTRKNLEQRRAAITILGWERIISELNAIIIDKNSDPEIGELVEVTIPKIGKERFLRVQCGTGRTFALAVPQNVKTALQANAWTYGIEENILEQKEFRT